MLLPQREVTYVFLDGDDIGLNLENRLRSGRVSDATRLSSKIREAITELALIVESSPDMEIIIFGGDELMFRRVKGIDPTGLVETCRQLFQQVTGLNMSVG